MILSNANAGNTVEAELERARRAIDEDNIGMARVCCRRAIGLAMAAHGGFSDGSKTMHSLAYLEILRDYPGLPSDVSNAALRLRSKRGEDVNNIISTNPLGDAEIILGYIQGLNLK